MHKFSLILFLMVFKASMAFGFAAPPPPQSDTISWSSPVQVSLPGFAGYPNEPHIFTSGYNECLYYGDIQAIGTVRQNVNLHVSCRDTRFHQPNYFPYYRLLSELNSSGLDSVPGVTNSGEIFFVSIRTAGSFLYSAKFDPAVNGFTGIANLGLTNPSADTIYMDLAPNIDGNTLYISRASSSDWINNPTPEKSDIILAQRDSTGKFILSGDNSPLRYINTAKYLEYAAAPSSNELELYFTRAVQDATSPFNGVRFYLAYSNRMSKSEPFRSPKYIDPTGSSFIEAPTITADGKRLYFHEILLNPDKTINSSRLWMISRLIQ